MRKPIPPVAVLDPVRLAILSRGLLMTLRSLNGRSGNWNDVSSSRTLQIQRFFKYFEAWIQELEATAEPGLLADSPGRVVDGLATSPQGGVAASADDQNTTLSVASE